MHRLSMFVVAALLLPAVAVAQNQARPVVIRASTVLDGKGGVLRDVALVIEGTKIVRIDSTASEATYDLRGLTVMPGWIDTHTHIADHFDRDTGKVHSQTVGETPQQAMLYADGERLQDLHGGIHDRSEPGRRAGQRSPRLDCRGPNSRARAFSHRCDPSPIRPAIRRRFARSFARRSPTAPTS